MKSEQEKEINVKECETLESGSIVKKAKKKKKAYIVPKLSYEGNWDTVTMQIGVSIPPV